MTGVIASLTGRTLIDSIGTGRGGPRTRQDGTRTDLSQKRALRTPATLRCLASKIKPDQTTRHKTIQIFFTMRTGNQSFRQTEKSREFICRVTSYFGRMAVTGGNVSERYKREHRQIVVGENGQ